jgi:hypothetical protein
MFSSLPPFPVSPEFFSAFNVFILAAFVAAAKQNDQGLPVPSAIDSVSGAHIDPELDDSFADGL